MLILFKFVRNFQTNDTHYVKVGSKMSKLLTDIYNAIEGAIPQLCDIYLRSKGGKLIYYSVVQFI